MMVDKWNLIGYGKGKRRSFGSVDWILENMWSIGMIINGIFALRAYQYYRRHPGG